MEVVPASVRAPFGLRDWVSSVDINIRDGRVSKVIGEVLVEGRSRWLNHEWSLVNEMPSESMQSRAYMIEPVNIGMRTGRSRGLENIFTPQASQQETEAAHLWNRACLTSFRSCIDRCELSPAAFQYMTNHPEVARDIWEPTCDGPCGMGRPSPWANTRIKPNYRRRVLRLPDLDHCKTAVLNSLGSPASRRVYEYAIDQFIAWYCSEPRLAFNRIVVVRYRMYLESRHLAANTINQQLAAVRRLAHEAADAGLLSPELAAGISRVKGVKQLGFRSGNWLSAEQSSEVLKHAGGDTDARQARLCDVGHAVRLWLSQVGTGRFGVGRHPDAPRTLGSG